VKNSKELDASAVGGAVVQALTTQIPCGMTKEAAADWRKMAGTPDESGSMNTDGSLMGAVGGSRNRLGVRR
jgi:hypothetical protein